MTSELVGVGRFELPASSSRTKRAAKLRHTPPVRNRIGTARDLDSLAETRTRSGAAANSARAAKAGPGTVSRNYAGPG